MGAVGIKQVLAAKRVVKAAAAKRAARKYTWVWDKIIKEAQGVDQKSTHLPPGFKGTQDEKFQRALLYKNRIINWAQRNPVKYSRALYRGTSGWEKNRLLADGVVDKNTLSSFTKVKDVAKRFASSGGMVLKLNIGKKSIPGIDFTSGKFQSEFGPGGVKFVQGRDEREVLLPPGRFTLGKRNPDGTYQVSFTIRKLDTSYLHKQPQREVAGKNSTGKYIYRDPATGSYYKIKTGGERVAATPPPKPKPKPVAANKNSKGRAIHRGPKGGTYILSASGKPVYKTLLSVNPSSSSNAPFGRNSKDRIIYKGIKGGFYVKSTTGKKIYKFIY